MSISSRAIVAAVDSIDDVIHNGLTIRPDFSMSDLPIIVGVIFALVMNGVSDASDVFEYLDSRGCRLSRKSIAYLLDAYEGDDPERHLWFRQHSGDYTPIDDVVREVYFPASADRG